MSRKKLWAALVALACITGLALADNNVLNHGTYYVNAPTGLKTDASGNLYTNNALAPADQNLTFSNIISNSSLALGGADSSAVLDTHTMRLGMLLFKCSNGTTTATGDTTVTFRVAFQIRTHLAGAADSMSTFPIYLYGNSSIGATATTPGDTTASGQLLTGTPTTALNATPDANTPWSGEYTLVVQAKRFAHGSSIAVNGHTFYYPNGIAIPLSSIFGRDIYSPFTSIRVRLMTVEKANAAFATEGLSINVSLVGTPL